MRSKPNVLLAALLAGMLGCAAEKSSTPSPVETRTTVQLVHANADQMMAVLEQRKPAKVSVLHGAPKADAPDGADTNDREIIVVGSAEDVATVLALVATLDVPPGAAPDAGEPQAVASPATAPAVRLVYVLPAALLDQAQRGEGAPTGDQLLDATVKTLQERVGTDGRVARAGPAGLTVDLTDGSAEQVAHARRRVEQCGRLELRILADERYRDREGKLVFDLDREKGRLEDWLDHGNRASVQQDPSAIDRYNDDADHGPLAQGKLRWCPHVVRPRASKPAVWDFALSASSAAGWVACYATADFNYGMVPKHVARLPPQEQRLLEFVAVNVDEKYWTDADLERSSVKPTVGTAGTPCLEYRMRGERASEYADWSVKHRNKRLCVLMDGLVLVTPFIPGRIASTHAIADDYTPGDMEDLAAILRTRPLAVAPQLVRQEAVTPPGDR